LKEFIAMFKLSLDEVLSNAKLLALKNSIERLGRRDRFRDAPLRDENRAVGELGDLADRRSWPRVAANLTFEIPSAVELQLRSSI
jgi:hypothetical protein